MIKPIALATITVALTIVACKVQAGQPQAPTSTKYGKTYTQVQAVFDKNCVGCHGARGRGRISLNTYEGVMKGGEDGPIVKAGDPAKSPLVQAIKHANGYRSMPPGRALADAEVKLIEGWVKAGAKANK